MRLQEGDVFSRRDYLISLRKIAQLGFWELEGEPTIAPVQGADEVDITVRGKEVGRNEIQFGGGYSGVDGFFGTFSFASRNFLGRGSQLSVSGQIGGETTRYSLNYVEPYFMKSRATVGGAIFARDEDYDGFNREGQGLTAFWSYPTSTFSAVRLTGAWEASEVVDEDEIVDTSRDEYTTLSLTPSYTFDNRDNPFRPTRGSRFTGALEVGSTKQDQPELPPDYRQGATEFLKPRLGYTQYWRTFKKQYVGVHAEAGLLATLGSGGRDPIGVDGIDPPFLPVFERFFLGGERSIRAVETRSVGPRIRQYTQNGIQVDDLALGGDQYYLVNFEYNIPFSEMFELTGFLDVGNAYGVSHVDWRDLVSEINGDLIEILDSDAFEVKATAGVELRFHTPVLQQPLRLIYGCKVAGDFFDDEGNCDFQFSIGRTFQ
jgi:outer membrane protein insertion porin family